MNIRRKQMAALFIGSLIPWIVGNGLVPLLPIYAAQLGATSAVAGAYLAISYLAIALGALSAGWVSGKFHQHKLPLIITGFVAIPVTWFMGQAGSVLSLTVLTAVLWFCGGLGMALVGILAGLSAGANERGKVFGVLALTSGLGAFIGNLGVGWLVDSSGYEFMFAVLAVFLFIWPLSAILLDEKEAPQPEATLTKAAPRQKLPGLGKSFYFLYMAAILASVTGFFVLLLRSIIMGSQDYGPLEISSTGAIGGLISMPFPLLMGWLSDRIGRKSLLFFGYLATLASIILLRFSSALWNFWIVLALQGIGSGSAGIGNALVTDLVSRESVGKGIAVFGSAAWLGGVLGYAIAGFSLQHLGFLPTINIGVCVTLVALGMLIPIQSVSTKTAPTPGDPA